MLRIMRPSLPPRRRPGQGTPTAYPARDQLGRWRLTAAHDLGLGVRPAGPHGAREGDGVVVAFIVLYYGTNLIRHDRVRRTAIILFVPAFVFAGIAGAFGAFITKVAPVT